jgi:hypothetical protein
LFVVKVLALVGDLAMPGSDGLPPQFAILRTTLRASQPLLRCGQPAGGGAAPARIVDVLTVAGGGETDNPDVDTGLAAGHGQRIRRDVVTGEHQHPAASRTLDLDRLHPTLNLAVQVDLDLADALQIHPVLLCQPTGAIPIFGPLHTVESARTLKPRIPCLDAGLGRLDPPEEPGERLIESAQRGLLTRKRPHRHIRARRPDLAQLRRLIPVVDAGLAVRPRIPALL